MAEQTMTIDVRKSAKFIADNSVDVTIDVTAIEAAARWLYEAHAKHGVFDLKRWRSENPLHCQTADRDCLQWIFLVDTLNFSFWCDADAPPYTVAYRGAHYTGYWSLCAAVNRALDAGVPLLDAGYLADVTAAQLADVFRSETSQPIPLLAERQAVLNDMGRTLLAHFDGHFENVVRAAGGSALRLVSLVAQHFASFRDVATYAGRPVQLMKRAQILAADVWAAFEAQGPGAFSDIDEVTMFADYRVPQILVHLGVLNYSPALLQRLHSGGELPNGDPLEVQIRGCSIWSVELLREQFKRYLADAPVPNVNAITIDFYLWDHAKQHAADMQQIPIHRTRSIFY